MSVEIVSWSNGTDAQIAAMLDAAAAGEIDLQEDGGWAVGDVRTMTYLDTASSVYEQHFNLVITSFAEYNGCGNLLQFDFAEIVDSGFMLNADHEAYPYSVSPTARQYMRKALNMLPYAFQDRLKTFSFQRKNTSGTIETITGNKLALRSQKEVFGTGPAEGQQISYYTNANNRIKYWFVEGKEAFSADPQQWFLRTLPSEGDAIAVSDSGTVESLSADERAGFSPFGCLGGYEGPTLTTVKVDEEHFPDQALRDLVRAYDKDNDGYLSPFELENVRNLEISHIDATYRSISGIQYLPWLTTLNISGDNSDPIQDEIFDFTYNTKLRYLFINQGCHRTRELKINSPELEYLRVWNSLGFETFTFVTTPTKLNTIDIRNIKFGPRDLDITNMPALTHLTLRGNAYRAIDIRNNQRLLTAFRCISASPTSIQTPTIVRTDESMIVPNVDYIIYKSRFTIGYNPISEDNYTVAEYLLEVSPDTNIISGELAITAQPDNISAGEGDNITFSCSASGSVPISYEWQTREKSLDHEWAQVSTDRVYTTAARGYYNYCLFRCKVYNESSLRSYKVVDTNGTVKGFENRHRLSLYTDTINPSIKTGIPIDEAHFPDAAWRQYVSSNYDSDQDGYLSDSEIANIRVLSLSENSDIVDLNVEFFTALTKISLMRCETIRTLTLGTHSQLTELNTFNVGISSYDLRGCLNLVSLKVYGKCSTHGTYDDTIPAITSINFGNSYSALVLLNIYGYDGPELSFDIFPKLEHLNLQYCANQQHLDLTDCAKLNYLLSYNMPALVDADCHGLSDLEDISLRYCPLLESVGISDCAGAKYVYLYGDTLLSNVVLGESDTIERLFCDGSNALDSLDISGCSKLLTIYSLPATEYTAPPATYPAICHGSHNLNIIDGRDNRSLSYPPNTFIITEAGSGNIIIIAQPQSASVIEGEDVTFSIAASGNDLSYQWEVSIDDGETWADIRGAAASSFSFAASLGSNGNKVRCKVTNSSGSVYSDTATLTVEEDTRLSAPVIDTQPSSVSVAEGGTANFSLLASGDNLAYQWQINQNGTWYSIAGATSASYSITASLALNGARYRCQVSNAAGSIYSSEASLLVTGGQSVSTPTITSNPRSVTLEEGQLASFRVLATGGSLSYQWQVKRNNTWYAISGATSQILSVRAASDTNGNQYRCQVSNVAGVAYSAVATLTVRDSTPLTFYGYHSIIISGKNTYGEWKMYPTSRPHVAPPEVKTSYVEVPGADGGLDYTELLNGKPNYGYRKGSWEFLLIPQEKWPEVYRSLCNFLHGREHTIVLEDDPKWTYRGRLSVNEWRSAAHNSLITIDYILDPIATSTDDEEYDPDADDLDAAGRILRKPGNEDSAIILWNGTETVVPIDSLFEDGDNIFY